MSIAPFSKTQWTQFVIEAQHFAGKTLGLMDADEDILAPYKKDEEPVQESAPLWMTLKDAAKNGTLTREMGLTALADRFSPGQLKKPFNTEGLDDQLDQLGDQSPPKSTLSAIVTSLNEINGCFLKANKETLQKVQNYCLAAIAGLVGISTVTLGLLAGLRSFKIAGVICMIAAGAFAVPTYKAANSLLRLEGSFDESIQTKCFAIIGDPDSRTKGWADSALEKLHSCAEDMQPLYEGDSPLPRNHRSLYPEFYNRSWAVYQLPPAI